jgi:hypothetical protein
MFGDVTNAKICLLLSGLSYMGLLICVHRRIEICNILFSKIDLVFLGIFLVFLLNKIFFPDSSSDTIVSEIFIEKFAFTSKLIDMKPYLPFTSAWFSLPDRIFFYTRNLFGYRGTLLINYFIIVVLYYKTKEIVAYLFQSIHQKLWGTVNKYFAAVLLGGLVFFIIFKEYLILGSLIIKGDLFVLPLFFECLLVVATTSKLENKYICIYLGILSGFGVALKLTNIIYFIPLILYYCVMQLKRRKANFLRLFAMIVACGIPSLPYLIYSTKFTGNPVFPFFNSIFKSPYYPISDFKDLRWGGHTVIETVFWPILSFLQPTRYAELGFNSGSLLIGCIVSIIVILMLCRKIHELRCLIPFVICFFISTFLWSFSTGYARYAMPLELLGFLILFALLYALIGIDFEKYKYLICAFILSGCISICLTGYYLISVHYEWSWRPSVFQSPKIYLTQAKENLPFLFHDRNATDDPILQQKFLNVKTWICLPYTSFATIANPNADFFYVDKNAPIDPRQFTENYFKGRERDNIYALINNDNISESYYEQLHQYGFVVVEKETISLKMIDANKQACFLKLMLANDAEKMGILELSLGYE